MAKKKSDQPEASAEQTELEQRVDAMMSVEAASKATSPAAKPAADQPAPVSTDLPTAPQLPPKLLKTIGATKTSKAKTVKVTTSTEADEPADPADPPPERILKLHIDEDAKLPELDEPDVPAPRLSTNEDPLEDSATDAAVDDITAHEADLQLAVDDARARRRNAETEPAGPGLLHRFFTSPWTWLFIIGIAGVAWAWFH